MTRLRQLVLVAEELEPLASSLRRVLGLGEGWKDPNIIEFGLENIVLPVGDTFLEVVAPVREGTAAGRYLDRCGPGGYMVILQVPDMAAARIRVDELGMRVVWKADLDDISGTHLHPKDTGGAILSLDQARPPGSWRWAGPGWEERASSGPVCGLEGATLISPNPRELAERWAAVAGLSASSAGSRGWSVSCGDDGGVLRFEPARNGADEGLAGFSLRVTDGETVLEAARAEGLEVDGDRFHLGGVVFRLVGDGVPDVQRDPAAPESPTDEA